MPAAANDPQGWGKAVTIALALLATSLPCAPSAPQCCCQLVEDRSDWHASLQRWHASLQIRQCSCISA